MCQVRKMIDAIAADDFDGARVALKASLADYMAGRAYVSNSDLFGRGYKDDYANPNVEDELKMVADLNGGEIRKHDKTGAREEAEEHAEYDQQLSLRKKKLRKHLRGDELTEAKTIIKKKKNGKWDWSQVNLHSIEVDGVDSKDYPDLSDAYVSYAEWKDGSELSDAELEAFGDENGDIVHEKAHDSLH